MKYKILNSGKVPVKKQIRKSLLNQFSTFCTCHQWLVVRWLVPFMNCIQGCYILCCPTSCRQWSSPGHICSNMIPFISMESWQFPPRRVTVSFGNRMLASAVTQRSLDAITTSWIERRWQVHFSYQKIINLTSSSHSSCTSRWNSPGSHF